MGSFDSVVGFLLQVLLSSLTNSPTDMKSFVSVIGLIGAAAAAPQYLADTPEVAAAKVEFKAAFDMAASEAAAALDAAGAVLEGSPAAEPYVHVEVLAEPYVHDEPALEAVAEVVDIAAEPYVHVEVPAEPYVHVEPAAEPVVAPAVVPAPLKLAPAPVAPAPLTAAPVLPAGFYAAHHLAGYPAPLGYYPYALPVPGCFNNKGQAVECLLPKIAAPVAE